MVGYGDALVLNIGGEYHLDVNNAEAFGKMLFLCSVKLNQNANATPIRARRGPISAHSRD